jgi:hypothetical protein
MSPDRQVYMLLGEKDVRTTVTPRISNPEDGYSIYLNELGWLSATRSAVAYSSGAGTLKIL